MNPNPELCARYGTKVAESPMLAAAAAALGTGGLLALHHHAKKQREEDALAELAARQAAARDMAETRQGLFGVGGGIAPDTTDWQGAGSLRDMDPRLGGISFEKGGAVVNWGNLGKVVGGGAAAGAGVAGGALGRGAQAVGQGLQQGFGATGRLVRAAGPTLMEGVKAPGAAPALGRALGGAGKAMESGGAALAGSGAAAAARAGAQGVLRPAGQSFLSKPLLSPMTKVKLMGGAAALGAGYAGLKGLGAAKDYMSIPAGTHHQGYVRHDVNEYGY